MSDTASTVLGFVLLALIIAIAFDLLNPRR